MTLRLAPFLNLALATLLALAGALPATALAGRPPLRRVASAPTEDPSGARVIVRYKADSALVSIQSASSTRRVGPLKAATMAQRLGLALRDGHLLDTRTQVLRGDTSISSAELARRLAADPDVEFAVPDLRRHVLAAPNDPLFAASAAISPAAGQWYLQAPSSTLVSAINAQAAWALSTGSSSIVVADIDTGVRYDHPDLAAKLLPGRNFVSTSGSALGSGWSADASDPGDYTTTTNQCGDGAAPSDSSWHGTQVIGIIGAQTDNGIGMASVGRNVALLPVRALGTCGGYDSDIVAAMLWAAGIPLPTNDPQVPNPGGVPANPHPAQVINLSLGSTGSCANTVYAQYFPQILAAGVSIVVAAGNDEGLAVGVPADCSGAVAVGGIRQVGTKVGFSNVGPEVALSAPAGNCVNISTGLPCLYPILTTTNPGARTPVAYTAGQSGLYSDSSNVSVGTSFATPLVSGVAALMLSVNPGLQPAQIRTMLQGSARTFPTTSAGATTAVPQCHAPNGVVQDECICTTSTCGAGMLDAGAAVAAAAGTAMPVPSIQSSPTTLAAGQTVTLDGSGSTVASGLTVAGYSWAITSPGAGAAFSGATNGAQATVTTSSAGSFTVTLTVTDSVGQQRSASKVVNVTAAPPTAQISASASTVTAGASVGLDGSASRAASGQTISSYQWTVLSGGGIAAISGSSTAATATLVTSGAGSVTVQLTVTDSDGGSASTSATITAQASAGTAAAGSGGGGGGAVSATWLMLLALAVGALWRDRRQARRPTTG